MPSHAKDLPNPEFFEHSLGGTAAVTGTFSRAVNCVQIDSDVDALIRVKFGAAAPTGAVINSAPVDGFSRRVGPSYGMQEFKVAVGATTVGIYNTSGSTLALGVTGFPASTN